jgi:hypothetical protein
VTWANLGILCGTILLPFPTAVLADAFRAGSCADEQTAAILYAGLAVLISLAWLALFLLLHHRQYPTPASQHLAPWRAQMRRPILGSFSYAGGALAILKRASPRSGPRTRHESGRGAYAESVGDAPRYPVASKSFMPRRRRCKPAPTGLTDGRPTIAVVLAKSTGSEILSDLQLT